MPSLSSSSFNAVTTATTMDAAPTDDAKTPAKDGFEKEAADETVGGNTLFQK